MGEELRPWTVVYSPLCDDLGLEFDEWDMKMIYAQSKDDAAIEAIQDFNFKIVVIGVM